MRLASFGGAAGKPAIDITLDAPAGRPASSYVHTYSTLDSITGTVAITAPATADIRFSTLDISFIGMSHYPLFLPFH